MYTDGWNGIRVDDSNAECWDCAKKANPQDSGLTTNAPSVPYGSIRGHTRTTAALMLAAYGYATVA